MGFPTEIRFLCNFEDTGLCFVNWRMKVMSYITKILRITTIKTINKVMQYNSNFQVGTTKNVFYKLSVVFPEKVDIILQTPGKILNVENENTVCSTMLSKEPIWTMICRSDLRRTHSTVDDKMFGLLLSPWKVQKINTPISTRPNGLYRLSLAAGFDFLHSAP